MLNRSNVNATEGKEKPVCLVFPVFRDHREHLDTSGSRDHPESMASDLFGKVSHIFEEGITYLQEDRVTEGTWVLWALKVIGDPPANQVSRGHLEWTYVLLVAWFD